MTNTLATAGLSVEQIEQAGKVYRSTGYFDYGITFNPNVIPAEHTAKWIPRYMQYLRELDAPVEELQAFENLRAEILGIEPETIEGEVAKPQRQAQPKRTTAPRPTTVNHEVNGSIDYAAAINQMQKDQAA